MHPAGGLHAADPDVMLPIWMGPPTWGENGRDRHRQVWHVADTSGGLPQ